MKIGLFLAACFFSTTNGSPVATKTCSNVLSPVIGSHYYPPTCDENSLDRQLLQRIPAIKDIDGHRGFLDLLGPLKSIVEDYVIEPGKKAVVCTACKSGVLSLQQWLSEGYTQEDLTSMLGVFLCDTLQIISRPVCSDYLTVAAPALLYILNTTDYSPQLICGMIAVKYCDIGNPPELQWEIPLPDRPKEVAIPALPVKEGKPVLKVLHLADTHVDDLYVEGSWDECGLPLCCRDPCPDNNSAVAGKYGGWMCDIPEITLDSMLDFVVNDIKDIDHVIWTGDIPAHDLWAQSKERNLLLINKTITKIRNVFPGENVVLPSLGNHEPVPGNLLPTPKIATGEWSNEWLYNSISDHWTSDWLTKDEAETIKYSAYYKKLYRENLLLISINSVFCYSNNWWLVLDNKDPAGELQWLVDSLVEAESLGQKVHIIAHIPPGNIECLQMWTTNYYRIIERFRDTVVGNFFGHTHNDEFELVPDSTDYSKTAAMFFIGPSVTTYTYINPGFRVYYIDGDHENTTRKVLDYETWIMDLEASNRDNVPVWKKLYSAKEAFGIESMEPDQWRKVYERIKTDDAFLQQYHRFFWKDSPKRPECGEACRQEYLCSIVSCTLYDNL